MQRNVCRQATALEVLQERPPTKTEKRILERGSLELQLRAAERILSADSLPPETMAALAPMLIGLSGKGDIAYLVCRGFELSADEATPHDALGKVLEENGISPIDCPDIWAFHRAMRMEAAAPADALAVYRAIALENPEALASLDRVVALEPDVNQSTVRQLCRELLDRGRVVQGKHCVASLKNAQDELWLQLYASYPSLTEQRISELIAAKPALASEQLAGLRRCESDPVASPRDVASSATSPHTAAIYFKLADNTKPGRERLCLIAHSAAACLHGLETAEPSCNAPASLAAYANAALESGASDELNAFLDSMYGVKGALYARLGRDPAVESALLQMHTTLAFIYDDIGDRPGPFGNVNYHRMMAIRMYERLNPGERDGAQRLAMRLPPETPSPSEPSPPGQSPDWSPPAEHGAGCGHCSIGSARGDFGGGMGLLIAALVTRSLRRRGRSHDD